MVAAAEETVGFLREVVDDAFGAGFVGLVDVDALDGATEGGRVVVGVVVVGGRSIWATLIVGLAADGVVEDEDFGSAGAKGVVLVSRLNQIHGRWVVGNANASFKIFSISG